MLQELAEFSKSNFKKKFKIEKGRLKPALTSILQLLRAQENSFFTSYGKRIALSVRKPVSVTETINEN
jgi:hypothetical protein